MEEEQVYTIPLRDVRKTQRHKRAAKAVKLVQEFLRTHMKVDEVKISSELNQEIWSRSAENPPPKIRVRVNKITGELAEALPLE